MGRALDSRWIMAVAFLSVLAAVAWSIQKRRIAATPEPTVLQVSTPTPRIELLGVPEDAQITLDGARIETKVFGVSPGTRHAVEVRDEAGGVWRQVFRASGTVALVVELQEPFGEPALELSDEQAGTEAPDSHEGTPAPSPGDH